jgi:2-polyprenyl-3-methyl-5-hydroxy-6-metoxy-1,4-benzoquinol methylase
MGLISRITNQRTIDAARQYFTDEELLHAEARRDTLRIFDAVFRRRGDELIVQAVPDDPWLRDHVASLPEEQAVWEVAAFVKVRRISTPEQVVSRARSGELYDESYFTKRGGGAPYVGYPLELNGFQGNFAGLADEIGARFEPRRLLDVGCATGHLVKALREKGIPAEGIDFSQWAVDNAVTPVVQGSALELPWAEGEFDTVISQDFMEHMHPDDLPTVIAEQVRVVEPGGTIAHLIPFYETDPPVQVDAHLCQATRAWWLRFLSAQPGVAVVHEPDEVAEQLLDRYVHLRRL